MRKINECESSKRKKKILHAAVHHYIKTGVPASSKALVSSYGIKCSSATVRNILAELEGEGYLSQIHTSSGRVPTDKGYRAYVDMLDGVRLRAIEEKKRIEESYKGRISEIEEVIVNTSKMLSHLSHYYGFASLPSKASTKIKDLEIIRVPDGQTLFVLVTNTGIVRHKLLPFDLSEDRAEFRYVSDYIRERLCGLTLDEAKSALELVVDEIRLRARRILSEEILRAITGVFDYEEDFYIEGISNILALPEFKGMEIPDFLIPSEVNKKAASFSLREGKNVLARMIKENLASDDDVKVIIGSESKYKGMESIAAVLRSYKKDARPIGVLGILGPKRMEYRKMMEIVTRVSRILEDTLEKL